MVEKPEYIGISNEPSVNWTKKVQNTVGYELLLHLDLDTSFCARESL